MIMENYYAGILVIVDQLWVNILVMENIEQFHYQEIINQIYKKNI